MDAEAARRRAIEAFHGSSYRCALAVTGGGATAISDLLAVPGASRTVLEAVVPYHRASLSRLLGGTREWPCKRHTARMLASWCYERAIAILESAGEAIQPQLLLGVGCTAALASDRPRRGTHRVHLAVRGETRMHEALLELTKQARSRAEEERLASDVVLHELIAAAGIDSPLPVPLRVTDRYDREIGGVGSGLPRL